MLIFNTYYTLNLKQKIYSINKANVWMHHYPPYHYKCSEFFLLHARGGCLATKQNGQVCPI